MHVLGPITQGIHHHLLNARMADVQSIAATGSVAVAPLIIGEAVVRGVVDPAERNRLPQFAALAGVVEDDIQNDLDPGFVEGVHGAAEIVELAFGQIARLKRKKVDRIVAPIFAKPVLRQRARRGERMDRQEFDRGDAKLAQVADDFGMPEPRHGPAYGFADGLVEHGVTTHVQFVDHAVRPWRVQDLVVIPVGDRCDDAAPRHRRGAVARVEREIAARIAEDIAAMDLVPFQRPAERARIRVDQKLVRIEAMAVQGIVRPMDAIAIEQARPRARQITMPDVVGALGQRQARAFTQTLEKAELDLFRMRREQRKIDAVPVVCGAQRIGPPFLEPDFYAHGYIPSGANTRTPSGGNVSDKEAVIPWEGRSCVSTSPEFPTSLPP